MLKRFLVLIVLFFSMSLMSCNENSSSNSDGSDSAAGDDIPSAKEGTGQLILELDEPVDQDSIEGYVVGQQESIQAVALSATKVVFNDIPPGETDVIVTGTLQLDLGEGSSLALNSGKRKGRRLSKIKISADQKAELPAVTLPDLGQIIGEVNLSGQTDHAGIDVYIPGTSYIAKTSSNGKFAMFDIPVGTHNLFFEKDGFHRGQLEGIEVESDVDINVELVRLLLSTGAEGMISLAQGAATSGTRTVAVDIAATSDAVLYRISENPTFINALWMPLIPTTNYTFTTAGKDKKIYVQFADANGLPSATFESNTISIEIFPANAQGQSIDLDTTILDPLDKTVLAKFSQPSAASDVLVADCQVILSGGEAKWGAYKESYVVSMLNSGIQSVCVQFRDADGILSALYSQSINLDVIPAAPNQLEVSSYSETSLFLSWSDNSSNESSFVIERSLDAVNYVAIATLASSSSSFADGGLVTGQLYYYRVKALNGSWESLYSENESAAPVANVPLPPQNMIATVSSPHSISVVWQDKSTNETSFSLQVAVDGGAYTALQTIEAGIEIFEDLSVTPGQQYIYRLCAQNSAGCSEFTYSNKVIPIAGLPAAPTNISATLISSSAASISWSDNSSDEDAFIIERSLDGNYFELRAAVSANATTYTDNNLALNQQYVYRLRAKNTGGSSSSIGTASIISGIPLAPVDLSIHDTLTGDAQLQWVDRSQNESSFIIERKEGAGSFATLATLGANAEAYTDSTAVPSTDYNYRVKAVHAVGSSSYTNEVGFRGGAPAAPSFFGANPVSSTSISLTWTDSSSIETGFTIERSVDGGGYAPLNTLAPDSQAYVDSAAPGGQTYRYRIKATHGTGDSLWQESEMVATDAMSLSWVGNPAMDGGCSVSQKANVSLGGGYSFDSATINATKGEGISTDNNGFSLALTPGLLSDGANFQANWGIDASPGPVSQFLQANYTINLSSQPNLKVPLLPIGALTYRNSIRAGSQPASCSTQMRAGLALGTGYSCLLLSNGKVACTGSRGEGQLGDGSFSEARSPLPFFPDNF